MVYLGASLTVYEDWIFKTFYPALWTTPKINKQANKIQACIKFKRKTHNMHFIKYMHVAPSPTEDLRDLRRIWYGIQSHNFMANR